MNEHYAAFHSALRGLLMACASFWLDHLSPERFDSVFHLANGRVRVVIEKYTSKDDTQPVKRVE
jgi:hypothetical protein